MKEQFKLFGRISLTMLSVGVGLAITAGVLMWWVELTWDDSLIHEIASLAALLIIIMAGPVVSGVIGIIEGLRSSAPTQGLWVAVGCLFGTGLLIVVGAVALGLVSEDNGGPELLDIITIAGLTSLAGAVAGGLTAAFSE